MAGITTALIGSAIIGAGTSLVGANKAASAQKKADKRVDARFQETKELLKPFADSGTLALEDLQASLGLLGEDAQKSFFQDFQTDPGFTESTQFGLDQVNDRFDLTGRGGGNLLSALSDRARNDLFGQFQIRQGQLANLAGMGQNAATSLGSAGQQSAVQSGQFLSNAGQLQGSGIINAGNALTGAIDQYAGLQGFNQGLTSAAALSPRQTSTVPTNRLSF